MTTRIISALVAVPLFFLIFYFGPIWFVPFAIGILSAIAAFELLRASGLHKSRYITVLCCAFAFGITPWNYYCADIWSGGCLFLFVLLLFLKIILHFNDFTVENIAFACLAGFIIPYFFSTLMRIMDMEYGYYLFLIPFVAAWLTDTFALFSGKLFGKHPLAPLVSPKKTVEGAIGGIVGAVISMLLYGYILKIGFSLTPNYGVLALIGFLGSIVGQIGDLSMSVIKRKYGIKDYGRIMPGHGGVLDRFDSVLFTAPMTASLLHFFPAVIVSI